MIFSNNKEKLAHQYICRQYDFIKPSQYEVGFEAYVAGAREQEESDINKIIDFLHKIQLEKYIETFDSGQMTFTEDFYTELKQVIKK